MYNARRDRQIGFWIFAAAPILFLCYTLMARRGGGGRRARLTLCHGGLHHDYCQFQFPSLPASAFLCWLLYTLAIYALPIHRRTIRWPGRLPKVGAGVIGSIIYRGCSPVRRDARNRTDRIRGGSHGRSCARRLGSSIAVPASIAGYHATLGTRTYRRAVRRLARAFAVVALSLLAARPGRACLCFAATC